MRCIQNIALLYVAKDVTEIKQNITTDLSTKDSGELHEISKSFFGHLVIWSLNHHTKFQAFSRMHTSPGTKTITCTNILDGTFCWDH